MGRALSYPEPEFSRLTIKTYPVERAWVIELENLGLNWRCSLK